MMKNKKPGPSSIMCYDLFLSIVVTLEQVIGWKVNKVGQPQAFVCLWVAIHANPSFII